MSRKKTFFLIGIPGLILFGFLLFQYLYSLAQFTQLNSQEILNLWEQTNYKTLEKYSDKILEKDKQNLFGIGIQLDLMLIGQLQSKKKLSSLKKTLDQIEISSTRENRLFKEWYQAPFLKGLYMDIYHGLMSDKPVQKEKTLEEIKKMISNPSFKPPAISGLLPGLEKLLNQTNQ